MTLYQTKNAHLFLISISCERSRKRDPILDQFSMITRPYTRLENGLKTITFPTAHTHITNIWEYPPLPRGGYVRFSDRKWNAQVLRTGSVQNGFARGSKPLGSPAPIGQSAGIWRVVAGKKCMREPALFGRSERTNGRRS